MQPAQAHLGLASQLMEARISVTEGMIVVLEFALAVGGSLGVFGLLMAPDGQHLGWTTQPLEGTPFSDYVVPALMLLVFTVVLPLIVATAALQRREWSLWGHLAVGAMLVAWIGAQVMVIGYLSLLQPIFAAIGFIIAALALVAIITARDMKHALEQTTRHEVAPSPVHWSRAD